MGFVLREKRYYPTTTVDAPSNVALQDGTFFFFLSSRANNIIRSLTSCTVYQQFLHFDQTLLYVWLLCEVGYDDTVFALYFTTAHTTGYCGYRYSRERHHFFVRKMKLQSRLDKMEAFIGCCARAPFVGNAKTMANTWNLKVTPACLPRKYSVPHSQGNGDLWSPGTHIQAHRDALPCRGHGVTWPPSYHGKQHPSRCLAIKPQ